MTATSPGGTGSCRAVNFGLPEVRCNIGNLPPTKVCRIDLRMYISPDAFCDYVLTNTLRIDFLVDPTLSIDPASDITETVMGPPCYHCYAPDVVKDW